MKLHPRYFVVEEARREFWEAFLQISEKHQLTLGEQNDILLEKMASNNKYQIRIERHPEDPSKRGDET